EARRGDALDRHDDVVHAAVDDQAREADGEVARAGMDARQRILRGIDHRRGLCLPQRLQVRDGVAPHVDVHELGDDLHERGSDLRRGAAMRSIDTMMWCTRPSTTRREKRMARWRAPEWMRASGFCVASTIDVGSAFHNVSRYATVSRRTLTCTSSAMTCTNAV